MKMKYMFMASAVAATALWSTNAYAVVASDFTVAKVTRSLASAGLDETMALPVEGVVYFDVEMATNPSFQWRGATYAATTAGERPRLLLNIPLKGSSAVPTGATEYDATLDVAKQTTTAVAYYVGSPKAGTLRFAYTVRPGDMVDSIDVLRKNGALQFEGSLNYITAEVNESGTVKTMPFEAASFDLATTATTTEGSALSVCGYSITVGDIGDANEGMFYKGLVPVTISMPVDYENVAPTAFQNTNTSNSCRVWLETTTGEYIPAAITAYTAEDTVIKGIDPTLNATTTTFNTTYSTISKGQSSTTATFAAKKFYIAVPEAIAVDTVRVCYGVPPTDANYKHVRASADFTLLDSPIDNTGYDVSATEISSENNVTFAAADMKDNTAFTATEENAIFVTTPAGSSPTVTIYKKNINQIAEYGTLYASVEQLTTSNASVEPSTYLIPLTKNIFTINLNTLSNASSGKALFRVRIPGLSDTSDKPFYIVTIASTKVERITIQAGEGGDYLQEFFQPLAGTEGTAGVYPTIVEYTMSVASTSTSARYFTVYPVFNDGITEITDDYYFIKDAQDATSEKMRVADLLRTMVQVQANGTSGSILTGDTLRYTMSVLANETSQKFYVSAVNDFASSYLGQPIVKCDANGDVICDTTTGLPKVENVAIATPTFAVRASNSNGKITGTADVCNPLIRPTITNRAPYVTGYAAPSTATMGASASFTVSLADTKGDYIVAVMTFDSSDATAKKTYLIANDDLMIAQMGEAEWEAKKDDLEADYDVPAGSFDKNGDNRKERTTYEITLPFTHNYEGSGERSWNFAAYDSTGAALVAGNRPEGIITITSAQKFTFNVYNTYGSMSASGYIAWANDLAADGTVSATAKSKWSFSRLATSSTLSRGSGTSASVVAIPFGAAEMHDAPTFGNFMGVNPTKDSFFYKWSATSEFMGLLPVDSTDPLQTIYTPTLQINRVFAAGGADVDPKAPDSWADLTLSAIFTLEYHEGDALKAYSMEKSDRNGLFDLGDYNSDSIPDGWLIAGFTNGRDLVEQNVAAIANEGDNLPFADWEGGDAIYRDGFIQNRLMNAAANEDVQLSLPLRWSAANPNGPCSLTGSPFTYKMRVRGRDAALNATDGHGSWISAPAWYVALRPVVEQAVLNDFGEGLREDPANPNSDIKTETFVNAGTLNNDGTFTPSELEKHALYMGSERVYVEVKNSIGQWFDTGIIANRTRRHKIPYTTVTEILDEDGKPTEITPRIADLPAKWADWAYVLNDEGYPIGWSDLRCQIEGHLVLVCTDSNSVDYEQIVDLYNYALDEDGHPTITWAYSGEETFVTKGSEITANAEGTGVYTDTKTVRHFIPVYDDNGENLVYPFESMAEMDERLASAVDHLGTPNIRELGGKEMEIVRANTKSIMRAYDVVLDNVNEKDITETINPGQTYPVYLEMGTVEVKYEDGGTQKSKAVQTYIAMTDAEGNPVMQTALETIEKHPRFRPLITVGDLNQPETSTTAHNEDIKIYVPDVDAETGTPKRAWIALSTLDYGEGIYEAVPAGALFPCYAASDMKWIGLGDSPLQWQTYTRVKMSEDALAAIEAIDKEAEDYAEQVHALIKPLFGDNTIPGVQQIRIPVANPNDPEDPFTTHTTVQGYNDDYKAINGGDLDGYRFEVNEDGLVSCRVLMGDAFINKMYFAPYYANGNVAPIVKSREMVANFAFHDWLVPAGILIDEYFRDNYDPRWSCWLDRYAGDTADADGDGINNAAEYYFWYYASRMRFASTFDWTDDMDTPDDSDDDVRHVQINTAIWPAIDIRDLAPMETTNESRLAMNSKRQNGVNDHYGMPARFAMGRRLRDDYDPEAPKGSPVAGGAPNHKSAMGNYWEPITANRVYESILNDPDNDGLSTREEFALGTNPIDCDTDNDWIPDGWEARWDNDNVNPLRADSGNNPDNDFYARLQVKTFTKIHDLYRIDFAAGAAPAETRCVETVTDKDGNLVQITTCCAYFDAADQIIRFTIPRDGVAAPLTAEETITLDRFSQETIEWAELTEDEKLAYTDILTGVDTDEVFHMLINDAVTLSHDAVYKTIGFSPYTAWCLTPSTSMSTDARIRFTAVNTVPFTNLDEYSASRREGLGGRFALSPLSMDSNNDGIPDGWSLYVGIDPTAETATAQTTDTDLDGLTQTAEFSCHAANLFSADMGTPLYTALQPQWTNKLYPTDPNNVDTDFDGVHDGAESAFIYTATVDSIWAGHGMNPTSMDTDGDGIADGYEFYWGEIPTTAVPEEPAVGEEDAEEEIATSSITVYPDPTYEGDVDIDCDYDGLTNYQEYMTGAFRHFRYDLSSTVSRCYSKSFDNVKGIAKGAKQKIAEEDKYGVMWEVFPNNYNLYEDLLNPDEVVSLDYVTEGGQPLYINPIKVARARGAEKTAPEVALDTVNMLFARTIVLPTKTQLDARKASLAIDSPIPGVGNVTLNELKMSHTDLMNNYTSDVQRISACLAAVDRMAFIEELTYDDYWMALTAIHQIDAFFGLGNDPLTYTNGADELTYEGLFAAAQETAFLKMHQEGKAIWEARRGQVIAAHAANIADTERVRRGLDPLAKWLKDTYGANVGALPISYLGNGNAGASYAATLTAAKCPLFQAQIRMACRGYNGGLWREGIELYFGPIGYMKPGVLERNVNNIGALVTSNILSNNDVAVPEIVKGTPTKKAKAPLFGTSPTAADTDYDGMDDYWEIAHGLNPLLGDFRNTIDDNDAGRYIDMLQTAYLASNYKVKDDMNPTYNPNGTAYGFVNNATGYDYYSAPWLTGVPFADPDGDGLINAEEAPNGEDAAVHHGTDPSPLWMTDPTNPNAFTVRFYGNNLNEKTDENGFDVTEYFASAMPVFSMKYPDGSRESVEDLPFFSFEVNEGYDTDGDGICDGTEVSTPYAYYNGDPQDPFSPARNFAVYFGGKGAMQTPAMIDFGPTALRRFTLECWVLPDKDQDDDVVLIDRPWTFDDAEVSTEYLRHNFILGLTKKDAKLYPYVCFTSTGGTAEAGTTVPQMSAKAVSKTPVGKEVTDADGNLTTDPSAAWTHLAATFDGTTLRIYVNGLETGSVMSSLLPATGVIVNSYDNNRRYYNLREAPFLLGATPGSSWVVPTDETPFSQIYKKCYKGYMDEVRIWNGARTATEIAATSSRSLTKAELIDYRLTAMVDRLNNGVTTEYKYIEGEGLFENTLSVYPVAVYTFNNLSSSTEEDEKNATTTAATPYETYPGEKLIGDDTVAGSFTYRRASYANAEGPLPTHLFRSYYDVETPKGLKSTQYGELRETREHVVDITPNGPVPQYDADGKPVTRDVEARIYEYAPKALNLVSRLPIFDIELMDKKGNVRTHMMETTALEIVNPKMSALPETGKYRMWDTAYWRQGKVGSEIDPTTVLKATANPYAHRFESMIAYDQDKQTAQEGFITIRDSDLMVYGDAYMKFTTLCWEPEGSFYSPDQKEPPTSDKEGSPEWFEPGFSSGNFFLNGIYPSNGGVFLDENVRKGASRDTDGDKMPDWWENYYGLDEEDPEGVNGPHYDNDGDFLTNYAEYLASSDPTLYSTAGNDIPDFHVPLFYQRGAPVLGMLYTDGDFMEDHWEAAFKSTKISVDRFDMYADPDGDGWSNYAEARVYARGSHSTNPLADIEQTINGKVPAYPTPALSIRIDCFEDLDAILEEKQNDADGEGVSTTNIVVHAFTAKGNMSAPDAVFVLPFGATEGEEKEQIMGRMNFGTTKGFLEPGNIKAGSVQVRTSYYQEIGSDGTLNGYMDSEGVTLRDDGSGNIKAFFMRTVPTLDDAGNPTFDETTGEAIVEEEWFEKIIGSIDYITGEYSYTISRDEYTGELFDSDGNFVAYFKDIYLKATYENVAVESFPATYTFSQPQEGGHLKEGKNNFFVFLDLNGNNMWNEGEPAGVPDQHDVDIGYDTINRELHVALTKNAPPGAIRVEMKSIIDTFVAEKKAAELKQNNATPGEDEEEDAGSEEATLDSKILNPLTKDNLQWADFVGEVGVEMDENFMIVVYDWETISNTTDTGSTASFARAYEQEYNSAKPYITEDEIFAAKPTGLDPALATEVTAMKYLVCYAPVSALVDPKNVVQKYAVAVAVNNFGNFDSTLTVLRDPESGNPNGGTIIHNTDLAFEWISTSQLPSFGVKIVKTHNAAGIKLETEEVVYEKTGIRGVSPIERVKENSKQFVYRYEMPDAIGNLNADATALFGNGTYRYTITLSPYKGGGGNDLVGYFQVQLTDSRDIADDGTVGTVETYPMTSGSSTVYTAGEKDTTFNAQDSYYVRAEIRYNGVLHDSEAFSASRGLVRIEAHYSASFNGAPVASTSDILGYDTDHNEFNRNLNHTVVIEKDKEYTNGSTNFYSTLIRAELRGLSNDAPVYLMAYLDLNENGVRDSWEPWGYLAAGKNAVDNYYYDPLAVTPKRSGKDINAKFYIQDVDVDGDKLADAWEWIKAGRPTTSFNDWCNVTIGGADAYGSAFVLWKPTGLTTFGAQVFGYSVLSTNDDGTVEVAGISTEAYTAAMNSFSEIMPPANWLELAEKGYTDFTVVIKSIAFDGANVSMQWGVEAGKSEESYENGQKVVDITEEDITELVTQTRAVYNFYGKENLGDEWELVASHDVSLTDNQTVKGATVSLKERAVMPKFFKVVLEVKKN